jgi:glycosyltransferase involved in cell wall biosynthesis
MEKTSAKKIVYLMKKYKGNNHLLNSMILGLDPARFDTKICYIYGMPDSGNLLDRYDMSIYLDTRSDNKSMFSRVILLRNVLKSEKTEVLHCHRHKAVVFGTLAAWLTGTVKVISHVHGLRRSRTFCRKITNSILTLKIAKYIAVSDAAKEDIVRTNCIIPPVKVKTIWNGIDIKHVDSCAVTREKARTRIGLPSNGVVFGTVGRLAKTKGHSYLLGAFAEVRKRIPEARLVIVGGGQLQDDLVRKAVDLGLSDSVILTGLRSDVLEILNGFDVFVFPSLAEGLPLALLEAMAARLPVIATNVGGVPEVINDTDCGMLVPPADLPALAGAMIKIAQMDTEKRNALGAKARQRVETAFTTEIMCNNIMDLYESVLRK